MSELINHCAAALTRKFRVERIWYLNARTTPGCELPLEDNLIVVTAPGEDPDRVRREVEQNLRGLALESELGVQVFGDSVIREWPRPLLIKMALSHGRSLFQFHPEN